MTAVEASRLPLPGSSLGSGCPLEGAYSTGCSSTIFARSSKRWCRAADRTSSPRRSEREPSPTQRQRTRSAHGVYHSAFKYVVYSLVPALPLFRVHQWIAYGGSFGEYYAFGLKAYLLGFAVYLGGDDRLHGDLGRRVARRRRDHRVPGGVRRTLASDESAASRQRNVGPYPLLRRCSGLHPHSSAAVTYGVTGLNTDSAQPKRSWPYWFQIGFLPLTYCLSA